VTTTTSTREEMTIRLEEKTERDLKLKHFEDDGLKVGRCRTMSARVAMRLLSLPGRRRDLHCLASTLRTMAWKRRRGLRLHAPGFVRQRALRSGALGQRREPGDWSCDELSQPAMRRPPWAVSGRPSDKGG
jgi:hypothetical protein